VAKPKNKIKLKELAQYKHTKFLMRIEKQAMIGYGLVVLSMKQQLKKLFSKEKLAKSLDGGWTGDIPLVRIALSDSVNKVIDKHLLALKWILLGKYAGKEAVDAAKVLKLFGNITPGVIPAAYFDNLDAMERHYVDIFGQKPEEMSNTMIKESLLEITQKLEKFIDQSLGEFRLKIESSIDGVADEHNFSAMNEVHQEAHNLVGKTEDSAEAVQDAVYGVSDILKLNNLMAEITETANMFEKKWENTVGGNINMASAAATHQGMLEVFGREDDSMRVVNIEMIDERVCSFCRSVSKDSSGKRIYYKLNDLKPSGYNFRRKKAEWLPSISPNHHRCRCQTVYVPPGYEVDDFGGLIRKS
jgi:hypothetical protein